jgi:hypothetical protein
MSQNNVGLPENKHGAASDMKPIRMRLKHIVEDGCNRYTLHSQDSPDPAWRKFYDFAGFQRWLAVYRGAILEEKPDYTLFEMPLIVDVFSIPRKFFNIITEPKDLVWTMRRLHPNYVAHMDRFDIVPGRTRMMGKSIYCKRMFLYRKKDTVPYCVVRVLHDYTVTEEGFRYI